MSPISDTVVPIFSWFYLYFGVFLVAVSVFCFYYNKKKLSIPFLLAGGFSIRLYIIGLDPYLHDWDERYHALVAKNLMSDWLVPTLYKNPVLPYGYTDWSTSHIWLHKQPFFLWQMALSMKIFGVNEVALRLPSALLSALAIWAVYRIGKLIYNEQTGFIAAVFLTLNNYTLEFVCGYFGSDHNDVAFASYVLFSIWAWVEYVNQKKTYWIFLIGLFAGIAVLNKWTTGMLVYLGWGLSSAIFSKNKLREFKNIGISILISFLIFLPWQIYTFLRWHKEAAYEYHYNISHFSTALEGHSGDWTYYFTFLPAFMGTIQMIFLFPGVILFLSKRNNSTYKLAILTYILAILIFFTIAQTKMFGFILPIIPLLLIIAATTVDWFINAVISKIKNKHLTIAASIVLIIGPAYWNLAPVNTMKRQDYNGMSWCGNQEHSVYYFNAQLYKQLPALLPKKNYVIVMAKPLDQVSCMFYSGFTTYDYLSKEEYETLKKQNIPIATFPNDMPDFLKNDTSVFKIPVAWR